MAGLKYKYVVLALLFAGLNVIAPPLAAQQMKARVTLMLERLPLEKQEKLRNLADDLEAYISDYDWTGEHLDDPIPVTVQIILVDQSVSYESRYQASFLISNNSDLQYGDKYWRFAYQDGTPLIHDENNYTSFLGFIDYYIYLVLAWEYDKMGEYAGSDYYEKARLISNEARFNSQFSYGWEDRAKEIAYLISDENKPFRKAKDLYFLGMSYVGEVDTTAQRYCGQAIDLFDEILTEDPDHEPALKFLQAHHLECLDLFNRNRRILETFMRLDPDHIETYEKYLK